MRLTWILLLLLLLSSCTKSKQLLSDGVWVFYAFSNQESGAVEVDTIRHQRVTLSFDTKGNITVNSIVNACSGKYKVQNGLKVTGLACTLMASVDSLDNVLENRFIEAITHSKTFHIIEEEELQIQYSIDGASTDELIFTKNDCAC